jgi:hypothetical protein
MLNLIPQCHAMAKSGGKFDFTFNRAGDRMPARKQGAAPVAPVAAEAEATTAPTEEAASGDVTAMADAQQEA